MIIGQKSYNKIGEFKPQWVPIDFEDNLCLKEYEETIWENNGTPIHQHQVPNSNSGKQITRQATLYFYYTISFNCWTFWPIFKISITFSIFIWH